MKTRIIPLSDNTGYRVWWTHRVLTDGNTPVVESLHDFASRAEASAFAASRRAAIHPCLPEVTEIAEALVRLGPEAVQAAIDIAIEARTQTLKREESGIGDRPHNRARRDILRALTLIDADSRNGR